MTPIGHFTSCAVASGAAGVLKPREVFIVLGYYILFLVVFQLLSGMYGPGMWGMTVYNTASDIPFYLFCLLWLRAEPRKQLTLAIFIGALILPAYSHAFDKLTLLFADALPEGMWRPHNVLHSPFAGLLLSTLATPLLCWLMKRPPGTRLAIFVGLIIGYVLHIVADTITYDYPIYWLWPFSDYHSTMITAFQAPDAVSHWLGNPYFVASPPVENNPQGYVMYQSEILLNLVTGALYALFVLFRRVAGATPSPLLVQATAPAPRSAPSAGGAVPSLSVPAVEP
jgi:membrane-bound metal-dependent hydrolase YbcI (DUF457 family)